jgi:hypothetical protein
MYLSIQTVIGWALSQEAIALYRRAKQYLLEQMGLSSLFLTTSEARTLLDKYLQHLMERLDEDRIANLRTGLSLLKHCETPCFRPNSNVTKKPSSSLVKIAA